jgi:hypothetical protein
MQGVWHFEVLLYLYWRGMVQQKISRYVSECGSAAAGAVLRYEAMNE